MRSRTGRWVAALLAGACAASADTDKVEALRAEVQGRGWVAFAARTEAGDLDLFVCRPDGSARRNLTRTPEWNEGLPRFSPDGGRLLFRRIPRAEAFDNNHHGAQGVLVLARSDGSDAKPLGAAGAFPWGTWSPDGRQILCLAPKGFSIVQLDTLATVRSFPRRGFFQQPAWSPDGRAIVGVANSFGESWSVARMDLASGVAAAISTTDSCTPDWFPGGKDAIYSWRRPGQKGYGWTQLWRTAGDGAQPQLVYAEEGRHVYGGHVSPDAKYVLFTGNGVEDGDPANGGAPMGLMRLADAPVIGGESPALRALHPKAGRGPVLVLPSGWEPCWTFSEAPAGAGRGTP